MRLSPGNLGRSALLFYCPHAWVPAVYREREVVSFDGLGFREYSLRCVSCGSTYEFNPRLFSCPRCGSLLEVVRNKHPGASWSLWRGRPPGVWRYREALPVPRGARPVTLGEGATPLVDADIDGVRARVWVKFEGANPTGSFKDRGMTVGVTVARLLGARVVVAASTGNTASSLAAYAARAGLRAVVVLPRGGVALGKLLQARLHGATVVEVDGSFDCAMKMVLEAAREGPVYPLNSFNPVRLEGQKTIAYEIVDELGRAPDYVVVPVGNGGNIAAIWKGFKELHEWGLLDGLPVMVGVQAEGASPLAKAWEERAKEPLWVDNPKTVASAIRIGRPVNWMKAYKAVEESGGLFISVTDEEILEAQRILARRVGLGVEPSSAASLAGLLKLYDEGFLREGEEVVLIATGHALKDPDSMAAADADVRLAEDAESLKGILHELAEG
jgi:threonine synthase